MKNEKTITLRELKKRCKTDELFDRVLRSCDTQDLDTEIEVGRLLAMTVDEASAARAAEEKAWTRATRAAAEAVTARADARAAFALVDTYEKIEKLLQKRWRRWMRRR